MSLHLLAFRLEIYMIRTWKIQVIDADGIKKIRQALAQENSYHVQLNPSVVTYHGPQEKSIQVVSAHQL